MFLVKTSARVLDTVRTENRQLFRGEPKGWEAGEAVLFIRNKGDLEEGEKPIAVAAKIAKIRPVQGSEATELASGVGGTFKFVAEYEGVTELVAAFGLEEAIGEGAAAAYRRVSIARKVEAADATKLDAFLKARVPAKADASAAEPAKTEAPKAKAPEAAPVKPAARRTEAPRPAAPKAEPEKPKTPAAAAASAKSSEGGPVRSEAAKAATQKTEAKKTDAPKPSSEADARDVASSYLPWYLEPIELSRLSLGFFVAGAFILGAVAF